MRNIQFAFFAFIFSALILSSCDTNPRPNYEPGVVTGVILSLDQLIIAPGESPTLTAVVLPADAPDKRVKWTSSNPGVATVDDNGTVNQSGTVNHIGTVTGIAEGTATITVTTLDDNFMAQCDVTVIASGSVNPRVSGVSISSTTSEIVYGNSATLTYTVNPPEAADKTVKWTSSDPDIVAVYQDGTVTAKSGGKATVTVSTVDGGKTDTCELTVIFPDPVSGVTLNLNTLTIAPNESAALIAVVSPANATDKQVKWKSSHPNVATVSANGTVTGKAAGMAIITVTADGNKDKTDTCTVNVTSGGTQVESITLDSTLSVEKNDTGALTATLEPSGATSNLQWISSNTDVATVTGNGAFTATVTGVSGGSAVITVSAVNGGKTANCVVTVNVPVTGVSLDHTKVMVQNSSGSIAKKASMAQLSAAVLPTDATNKQVTWTSSDTNVATVSANGLVTGKAVGNARITVTADENTSMKADCDVTVYFGVANASAWTSALTSISNAQGGSSAGSPAVFIINITGSFSVPGINSPNITGNYKEVRLTGGSGTMSLSDTNGSIIQTTANQTFVIDGPTLQGKTNNNTSLVSIPDGTVELRNGYIKGNNNASLNSNGGGVYVAGGNFTMIDGEISGNNASNYGGGGGVYISSGNFTMSGGTISGNTTDYGGLGGGVYVRNGNFTMEGGVISGNRVPVAGGGVYIMSGSFTMSGGTISGNTAVNSGGGVCVDPYGNFIMTDGIIYGSNADASLKNTAANGAAVYITSPQTKIENTITQYP